MSATEDRTTAGHGPDGRPTQGHGPDGRPTGRHGPDGPGCRGPATDDRLTVGRDGGRRSEWTAGRLLTLGLLFFGGSFLLVQSMRPLLRPASTGPAAPSEALAQELPGASRRIDLAALAPRALAADEDGRVWLAAAPGLLRLDPRTGASDSVASSAPIDVLRGGPGGEIWAASPREIFRLEGPEGGRRLVSKAILPEGSRILDCCPTGALVVVADGGARALVAFDRTGRRRWRTEGFEGFIVPGPHFPLDADGEGGVWVANPGRLRLERYDGEGRYRAMWTPAEGQGFLGCCNPASLLCLPRGRFVTLEKGGLRCRIFGPSGEVERLLFGPLPPLPRSHRFDLARTGHGGIWILDAGRGMLWRWDGVTEGRGRRP